MITRPGLGLGIGLGLWAAGSAPYVGQADRTTTASRSLYGLTKLRSAYTGAAITVRRSSDNATSNIGFTASGELDVGALLTFVGSNSGFVTTWFDQSTNGFNQTQGTTGLQPRIVNAGIVDRLAGRPAVYFNGSTYLTGSASAAVMGTTAYTFVSVFASSLNGSTIFSKLNGTGSWGGGNTKIGLVGTVAQSNFSGPRLGMVQFSGGWTSGSVDVNTSEPFVGVLYSPSSGNNTVIRTDSVQNTNVLTGAETGDGGSITTIGLGLNDSMVIFNGYIAEVMNFNGVVPLNELVSVEQAALAYYKPPISALSAAWASRVTAAGGTTLYQDRRAATAILTAADVVGLTDANCRLNLFAGSNLTSALVPLLRGGGPDTDTNTSFVSGDYTRATGLTPDGATKYLSWANNCANMFGATSAHMMLYRRTAGAGVDFTCPDSGAQRASLFVSAGETDAFTSTAGAGRLTFAAASPTRLCGASRTTAAFTYYENGVAVATDTGSGGTVPTSSACYVFSNSGINLFSTTVCGGYSVGPGLSASSVAAMATAWQNAMTILGRAV